MKKKTIKKIEKLMILGSNLTITHFNMNNSLKIHGISVTNDKIKELNRLHDSLDMIY